MPVTGTVCPGTQDDACFLLPNRFSPAAGCVFPGTFIPVITGALFSRNAPAVCVRVNLKLYVRFHLDRDADHRQPVTGTLCPGPNYEYSCLSNGFSSSLSHFLSDWIIFQIYQCTCGSKAGSRLAGSCPQEKVIIINIIITINIINIIRFIGCMVTCLNANHVFTGPIPETSTIWKVGYFWFVVHPASWRQLGSYLTEK